MINIIGLGPGNEDYITKLGEQLIKQSDVVNRWQEKSGNYQRL